MGVYGFFMYNQRFLRISITWHLDQQGSIPPKRLNSGSGFPEALFHYAWTPMNILGIFCVSLGDGGAELGITFQTFWRSLWHNFGISL